MAVVMAIGLMGIVVEQILTISAIEAKRCFLNPNAPFEGEIAANASKGRFVGHGPN